MGFTLSGISVLLRSSKVVLQDQLLAPAAYAEDGKNSTEPSPSSLSFMHVWALQAPPCVIVALSYASCWEDVGKAWNSLSSEIVWLILATCVSATALNLLGMYAIKELGASSMQIIGKLNTIILCSFSVAFLGETLPPQVMVGAFITICGIAYFENAQHHNGLARDCLPMVKPQTTTSGPCPPLTVGMARTRD